MAMLFAKKSLDRTGRLALYGMLMISLLAVPEEFIAGPNEATLIVSATILKRASLKVLAQPSSVVVTAADIARGYVDGPAAVEVAIQNNGAGGYLLEFASRGDFMRQILVRGLARETQLNPGGGAIAQPATGSGVTRTTLGLGFRFVLSESAQPGTYPWPMRLSVTPL
jgi:hypothetical protein